MRASSSGRLWRSTGLCFGTASPVPHPALRGTDGSGRPLYRRRPCPRRGQPGTSRWPERFFRAYPSPEDAACRERIAKRSMMARRIQDFLRARRARLGLSLATAAQEARGATTSGTTASEGLPERLAPPPPAVSASTSPWLSPPDPVTLRALICVELRSMAREVLGALTSPRTLGSI